MKKRILYIHQYFRTPEEGGGIRSYVFAKHLISEGYEVNMLTTDQKEKFSGWRVEDVDGIKVHKCSVLYNNNMGFISRVLAFFKFMIMSRKKSVKIGGDIVFATSTPLTVAIPAMYAKKKLKIPFIFEVRDLWPEIPIAMGYLKNPILRKLALWLEKKAYTEANHIIALSPGMKDGVLTVAPEKNVTTITNISDIEFMQCSEEERLLFRKQQLTMLDDQDLLVVYTGTLGEINGVSYLVKLAKAVYDSGHTNIKFLVVGAGKEECLVRKTAENIGVYDLNFFMLRSMAKSDIPKIYANAVMGFSLFIPVSKMYHNSANKFFDCLASGTPISINYLGWQKEELERNGAGIILDQQDYKRAAEQLILTIMNKETLSQMSVNAKKLAYKFEKKVAVECLENVVKQSLGK